MAASQCSVGEGKIAPPPAHNTAHCPAHGQKNKRNELYRLAMQMHYIKKNHLKTGKKSNGICARKKRCCDTSFDGIVTTSFE